MISEIPIILSLSEIQKYLPSAQTLISIVEQGFVALSTSKAIIPPVGELIFDDPPGDTHIKYGYIKQQPYFIIKIASGFYDNPKLGLKSSQGLMLLFSRQTGQILGILLDEGYLTNIRTAIASMITVKYLAPQKVKTVGIVGTGIQAIFQLNYLAQVCQCTNIMVWGRTPHNLTEFQKSFQNSPYTIKTTSNLDELTRSCNLIITATASTSSLLKADQVRSGTHITALGSDTPKKIELEPALIQKADLLVSDSISQSKVRGEFFRARKVDCLDESKLVELGSLIENPEVARKNENQITIADLTGVAVQDIMIAAVIFDNYNLTKA